MRPLVLLIIAITFLTGCTKEYPDYPYQKIETPVSNTLRDIAFLDQDSWIICGGDEDYGFILKTLDGGQNWSLISEPFTGTLNCVYFIDQNTGFAADNDILIYKTVDGGVSWQTYYSSSWPLTVNRNLRDICFLNDSTGFICGGKNLGNGVMYNTSNSGESWNFSEYQHEYRAVQFGTDNLHGIMAGYGSILKTSDGGNSFENIAGDDLYITDIVTNRFKSHFYMSDFNGSVLTINYDGTDLRTLRKGSSFNGKGRMLNSLSFYSDKIVCAGPNGFLSYSADLTNWSDHTCFGGNDINKIRFINYTTALAAGKKGGLYLISF